ncbi:radical SAM protein [Ignavigranum ruoffiae]|uniref:radical SAM protein n=1 Tax=Ignavigranum ruoffiae TaxID=89093 RepID=UPI0024ADB5C4|nr:radical SAM protein [Ignavigranum ruoffiae]
MSINNLHISPISIGIMTTKRCTAACQECCFQCSPQRTETFTIEQIYNIIDSLKVFKNIKVIAWTGGECTLLGDNLRKAISYSKKQGYENRIVSNGWWATSEKRAKGFISKLIEAGLDEINISTGDNHQTFIQFDIALEAAISAAELGISSILSVEKRNNAIFNEEDVYNHPRYKEFQKNNRNINLFRVISPIWVSFHSDNVFSYDLNESDLTSEGCSDIFETISISPDGGVGLCCGLTIDYIDALKLGDNSQFLDNPEKVLINYDNSLNDFIKIWIYTEGPLEILRQVKQWDSSFDYPKFIHKCLYCSYIYNDEQTIKIIEKNYKRILQRVLRKFNNKITWRQLMIGNS